MLFLDHKWCDMERIENEHYSKAAAAFMPA